MRCPMCAEAVLAPTYRHGIEVDVCPRCKGVWLDRGELEKILDALDAQLDASGAPAPPAPRPSASSPRPPPPAQPPPPRYRDERDDRYDERRRYEERYDERPWMDPRVLGGRGWAKGSKPPSGKKGKRRKHKSFLAEIVDELM